MTEEEGPSQGVVNLEERAVECGRRTEGLHKREFGAKR